MEINKVLLVDDEADIRKVGALSLTALAQWTVLEAQDGSEAVALAAREQPDVILLDVNMPGLDGPETFEKLRADDRTRRIPVVFMTASTRAQEVQRYHQMGAQGVIAKPFDPMSLADQIRALFAAS